MNIKCTNRKSRSLFTNNKTTGAYLKILRTSGVYKKNNSFFTHNQQQGTKTQMPISKEQHPRCNLDRFAITADAHFFVIFVLFQCLQCSPFVGPSCQMTFILDAPSPFAWCDWEGEMEIGFWQRDGRDRDVMEMGMEKTRDGDGEKRKIKREGDGGTVMEIEDPCWLDFTSTLTEKETEGGDFRHPIGILQKKKRTLLNFNLCRFF